MDWYPLLNSLRIAAASSVIVFFLGILCAYYAARLPRAVKGVLGASGCGKSMTLKCIAGVERPDRGTIVLDGEALFDSERGIDLPPQKRRVGYLFQSCALFADPGSVAACLLTGCKNIAPARKTGEHEVEVPDWGVRLWTARPVREDVRAVGVRAHQFHPDGQENRFPVEYLGEMEEPFGWIQEFRFQRQRAGTPPLWRRTPKELWDGNAAAELGVDPNHVLLLYE